jgi:hypothetical protein
MRAALVAAAIVLTVVAASAQEIEVAGVVVDARTEAPLAGVVLSLDGQSPGATTGPDGRFRFTLSPGPYVVSASLIGFALFRQAIEIGPQPPDPLTIRLSEGAGAFEEHVTVTGATGGTIGGAAGQEGVALHGRDLEALRGVTLDDPLRALHVLPAVAATDDFYSEFAVRGSPFRHVNLLVDGLPSPYLMHSVFGVADGGSIAMINSDAIGSLGLQPGSYPQHVGRRLGAQVGIDMREGNRERHQARLGLSGTSATMLAEGPLAHGRGSWLASARRSYLDLLLKRIDDGNNLAFGFTDGEAKLVFDVTPAQQLQLLAIAGQSRFNEKPDDLGANDEATVKGHSWLAGLSWRMTPSTRYSITQRIYTTGLGYRNRNRDDRILDNSRSNDVAWRGDAVMAVTPALVVRAGGDAQRLSARHTQQRALNDQPDLTTIGDYDRQGNSASAYADVIVHPSTRATLTAGARVDRWGPTKTSTGSPWASLDLDVARGLRVRLGTGEYRQFAELEQIAGVAGGGSALRPESATHLDIGVSQQLPASLSAQATWFIRNERDVLWTPGSEPRRLADGTIQQGRGDAPWVNALDGHARGLELILRRDRPSGLSGWLGYAYARDRYTETATGESFWADFDQRHGLSAFGRYPLSNRTTLGVKFRAGSNYPVKGYIGQAPQSLNAPPLFGGDRPLFYQLVESRNTLRLPVYSRLDFRLDRIFTWSKRRVTVFGEVANTLNRRNLRNVPYDVDRSGRVFDPTGTLLPILPSAGFVVEF